MRALLVFIVLICLASGALVGMLFWAPAPVTHRPAPPAIAKKPEPPEKPEPPAEFKLVLDRFEDGGFGLASQYTGPIRDAASLDELREAVQARYPRGVKALQAKLNALKLDNPPTTAQVQEKAAIEKALALICMYEGHFEEADGWLQKGLADCKPSDVLKKMRGDFLALLGINAMRRGEIENCLGCVGPSTCIFPLAPDAVHKKQDGSRAAVRYFQLYLDENPGDLRIIWLLNIAQMTLGGYPSALPKSELIPLHPFRSQITVGRFENVAKQAGLTTRGPNQAGGSIFDDFNADGLPDLFLSSHDADKGASFFVNRGDGTFEDRSKAAGLDNQIYALNLSRADFDNDGDLDVLMMRCGWEFPARLTLLRNKGDGTFDDVTASAGLSLPIACESAAWADYDNDGKLDLFLCGEYLVPGAPLDAKPATLPDPRNRCRLYHNKGDGTFEDVAEKAGVLDERCAKGSAWGDYDGDGRIDLFVSNMGQPCRLYHNEGNGVFSDVAPALGVTGPKLSFACWWWDYDNDGRLDLYVNDYRAMVSEVIAGALGTKLPGGSRPALYRNLGPDGFRDVTELVGLDRAMAPMGANFGDIDNDGYLDIYLGTGDMAYSGLDINLLFKNVEGKRFEDVTEASGTGHLQKGHGVSFADYDDDGDLDLFVELGGATPGDLAYNALFRNPLSDRHWLKVRLVGVTSNRNAIGATIHAELRDSLGQTRSIYRTIGNNSSFGGNSLTELIGLKDSTEVESLTITWPTTQKTQKFAKIAGGRSIVVTEGVDEFKVLPRREAK